MADTSPIQKTRLSSLDAYRGLVLLLLCVEGPNWGWQDPIVESHPDSWFWSTVAHHTHHIEWAGCVLWDLIQPSFMFMVGVSMAFSYAKRDRLGDSWLQMFRHAAFRSIVLVLLGVFLRSLDSDQTYWTFEDVLTQIGLGYVFLFLLWNRPPLLQISVAVGILVAYWLLFAISPVMETAGNPRGYEQFDGFFAHWNLNANPAHRFDTWFLNLFPREQPFEFHPEGYNTLNFIPSLSIMVMGLLSGELLRSDKQKLAKLNILGFVGLGCLLAGLAMHFGNLCPLVKKTWTPAFTVFSGGWCLLILAGLYGLIDLLGWRRWSFPLIVLGMNSIGLYVMIHLFPSWIIRNFQIHLGENYASILGTEFEPMMQNFTAAAVLCLICYWMYRRQLFLRI